MLVEVWGQGQGPPKANRLRGAEVEGGSSEGGEISIKTLTARPSEAVLQGSMEGFVLSSHFADEETEAL